MGLEHQAYKNYGLESTKSKKIREEFRGGLKTRLKPDGQLILAGDSPQLGPFRSLDSGLAFIAALWSAGAVTFRRGFVNNISAIEFESVNSIDQRLV